MAKEAETAASNSVLFPVVGIGASAGGLDAFKKLLHAIPEKSGMAYILIQHMGVTHESLLPELLAKATSIPVHPIKDEIQLEPDNIYVMPSGKILLAVDGILKLAPRDESARTTKTIDLFFSSLGVVHQNYAVGIVLSGADGDGTLGLKVIKANGGITFAQTTSSAAHESMPQTAINSGNVDFILPPEEIPAKLMEINKPFNSTQALDLTSLRQDDEEVLKQILVLLRIRRNVDFSNYKKTTIMRRIARRMALNKVTQPVEYLVLLRENKPEQDILYSDLLISVTSFFRDTKSFELLCNDLIPALLEQKAPHESLRIWVAGCATGQEAYSMAMCLHEYISGRGLQVKIQIFASDISDIAISKARIAIYEKSEMEGLSETQIEEYFIKTDGAYHLKKNIRELCVFAHHNLLKDPPFARMDVVSCRNVLIYMEPVLQKKAIQTFHYALNENGVLMLGKSETPGSSSTELFSNYKGHEKIYIKRGISGRIFSTTNERNENAFITRDIKTPPKHEAPDFQKAADDFVLFRFSPAGVVVNDQFDIVQFRGATGKWLEPAPGKASFNLLKMAREGLSFELRNILHKAKSDNAAVIKEHIDLITATGIHQTVTIEAAPLPHTNEPHFLVLFHDLPSGSAQKQRADAVKEIITLHGVRDIRELRIEQLEKELASAREDMRGITEEQEAANEELQSANEELLSGSEELKSLNEELETSQEELQSTNEELNMVNHELVDRNHQLIKARNYSEAIIDTIRDPLLALDKYLRIKNATRGFYTRYKTEEADVVGRRFNELKNCPLDNETLDKMLQMAAGQKLPFEDLEVSCKVPGIGERFLLINARPLEYIDGEQLILMSLEDITLTRIEKDELLQAKRRLEERISLAVEATGIGTWELDLSTGVLSIDNQTRSLFGFKPEEHPDLEAFKSMLFSEDRKLRDTVLANTIAGDSNGVYHMEYRIQTKDTQEMRWIQSKGQAFFDDSGMAIRFVGTLIDITRQKLSEQHLIESEARFRLAADSASAWIWLSGSDRLFYYFNKSWLQFRKKTLDQEQGNGWTEGIHPDDFDRWQDTYFNHFDARKEFHIEYRLLRHDGQYRWVSDAGVPRFSPAGIFEGYVGTCTDIDDQKMATEKLERLVEERTESLRDAICELEASNQSLEEFAYVASHDLQEPLRKIQTFSKLMESRKDSLLDEQMRLYIDKIRYASMRMSRLIDDILNFSQLKKSQNLQVVDLNKVVHEMLSDFELSIQQKGAIIESGPLPVIEAASIHLNQLFHNLMSNALKFSKNEVTPLIRISSRPLTEEELEAFETLPKNRQYTHIVFTDNGIGFSQEYAEKVFDIFQRLNGQSAYEGTGIGLAICRRIVTNLNGIIYVESEEGIGTTFHIVLPMTDMTN